MQGRPGLWKANNSQPPFTGGLCRTRKQVLAAHTWGPLCFSVWILTLGRKQGCSWAGGKASSSAWRLFLDSRLVPNKRESNKSTQALKRSLLSGRRRKSKIHKALIHKIKWSFKKLSWVHSRDQNPECIRLWVKHLLEGPVPSWGSLYMHVYMYSRDATSI